MMTRDNVAIARLAAVAVLALLMGGCPEDGEGGDGTIADIVADQPLVDLSGDAVAPDPGRPSDVPGGPELVAYDGQNYGPGGLGDPCFDNDDCDSGWCIESPSGFICTVSCDAQCDPGYACKTLSLPDPVAICVPNVLDYCGVCLSDINCFGGVCHNDGQNDLYCTALCSEDNPCPDGFTCQTATEAQSGLTRDLCIPASGSCGCSAASVGAVRPCEASNEHGVCPGFETCNGVDWGACNAKEPATESCDYQDNDCDGTIDEGFLSQDGKYGLYEHCGVCGQSCEEAIANALTTCDAETFDPPQCVVEECASGFFELNPFYCGPVPAKLCSPCVEDANCIVAGAECTELSDGSFCTVPCTSDDECPSGYGCVVPTGSDSLQCVPDAGTCACDTGSVGLQRACEATYQDPDDPTAPLVTCVGLEECTDQGWTECALGDDICDYSDNDCDGQVDDDWVNEDGLYYRDENCGVCGNNCLAGDPPPNGVNACDISGPVPTCSVQCLAGTVDVNNNPIDGCECTIDGTPDVPDGIDHDCDGVDGAIDGAIFVAKNGDDANAGSIDAPLRTIQAGIDKAVADGLAFVFVATGVYSESIDVAAGVLTYGGYSGDFRARDVELYQTAIFGLAPTPEQPGAVNAVGLDSPSGAQGGLAGFTVFGAVNKSSGGSSYAVYVADCGDQLLLEDNTIVAGSGGDGDDGGGGTSGSAGTAGGDGLAVFDLGTSACSGSDHRAGGAGGALTCGADDVGGGDGGTAVCPDYSEGEAPDACPVTGPQTTAAEENGADGSGPNPGTGGAGGGDSYQSTIDLTDCSSSDPIGNCGNCKLPTGGLVKAGGAGHAAAPGTSGVSGTGCDAADGSTAGGLWSAGAGQPGGDGGHGGGGGGGGAGGGVELYSCITDPFGGSDLGGSGGGGGSGGCGGTGGDGGTGGGGSFGIFVTYSAAPASLPVISNNSIVRGDGGDGGDGGTGGAGGPGGSGGDGGPEAGSGELTLFCAPAGGPGGDGGVGGAGAGGGGGCGGVSYGIFVDGAAGDAAWQSGNTFTADGTAGGGGQGGLSLGIGGGGGLAGSEGDTNY